MWAGSHRLTLVVNACSPGHTADSSLPGYKIDTFPRDVTGKSMVFRSIQYSRAKGCSIHRKLCGSWYCRCPGPRALLLCRVMLGDPYHAHSAESLVGRRRPPDRLDICGLPYDSVVAPRGIRRGGKKQKHREVVIFDRLMIYPEFHIELELE